VTSGGYNIADCLDQVSELIAEVGACYEAARRYRRLAGVCEERYLAPALDIASVLRRIVRSETPDRGLFERQIARLREVRAECGAAIEEVRATDLYRRARAAWHEGRGDELLRTLPGIFACIAPERPTAPVYHPVSLRGPRTEGGEHFIPATACADRLALLAREGIPAESVENGLGTDGEIHAVRLGDDPASFESPITLRIEPMALRDAAVCRVALTGDFLVYVPRLRTRFEVHCEPTVSDEWWSIRPDAYRSYLQELRDALAARNICCRTGI
jgi:hypothetical protein